MSQTETLSNALVCPQPLPRKRSPKDHSAPAAPIILTQTSPGSKPNEDVPKEPFIAEPSESTSTAELVIHTSKDVPTDSNNYRRNISDSTGSETKNIVVANKSGHNNRDKIRGTNAHPLKNAKAPPPPQFGRHALHNQGKVNFKMSAFENSGSNYSILERK